MSKIVEILGNYDTISLKEMEGVELMNRKDTKYFFNRTKLPSILQHLQPEYKVLDIGGNRVFNYRNIYFDTEDFFFYTQHHNQRVNRYKIRIRQYVESNLTFLEIKFKTNTRRTIKSRIIIPEFKMELSDEAKAFIRIHSPFDPEELKPTLRNDFKRFTLVNNSLKERTTIDTDLVLEVPGHKRIFSNLCIAELKMDGSSSGSRFKIAMRDNLCPEVRISKYSVGAAFMYDHLKQNNFKFKKLQINRIENVQPNIAGDRI
ncbi:MAG: polyphosphate polymerase domain-containing protein [Chitinophagales bacterium]